MNVSVGSRWESFAEDVVSSGRFDTVSDVVREGLRLGEERENRLRWLRTKLDASIAEGGDLSDEDIGAALDAAE